MAATHYGEDLRAIAQALEAKGITAFEIKRLPERYVIEGTLGQPETFGSKLRHWFRRAQRAGTESLTLNREDVDKLSRAGRAKRSTPGGLTQFRSLSNVLRTIGAYLDSNELELIELQKRAISVTLSHRDQNGNDQCEERSISSFYRDFLELCRKRS